MFWIILSFILGVAVGIVFAKVFFPNLATKYRVVEKTVRKNL